MYIPAAVAETDLTKLHRLIEHNSIGLLVSQVDGVPFATHLPFLLERTAGPYGTLVSHMARANPQWRKAAGQMALAIFSGPHAYISPTWYEPRTGRTHLELHRRLHRRPRLRAGPGRRGRGCPAGHRGKVRAGLRAGHAPALVVRPFKLCGGSFSSKKSRCRNT